MEPLTLARSDSGAFLSKVGDRDGWPTAIVGLMCLIKACQHGKAHQIKLEKTHSSRQTLYSILRTRSYLYTRCTRGTSTTTWSWPGGENSEEGGAGLRHCRPCGRCGRCRLSPSPPPPSPPLTPPPPSPPAPLLRLPLSHAVGISHPSLPPIAAAHAASVAAASIDRPHRSPPSPPLASPPLPKGEAARERERERSRLTAIR